MWCLPIICLLLISSDTLGHCKQSDQSLAEQSKEFHLVVCSISQSCKAATYFLCLTWPVRMSSGCSRYQGERDTAGHPLQVLGGLAPKVVLPEYWCILHGVV